MARILPRGAGALPRPNARATRAVPPSMASTRVPRRRRLVKAALWTGAALAVLVGAAVALRAALLDRWLWSRIASAIHDKYGLDVASADYEFSLGAGEGVIRGVRITENGKPVVEADAVELSATARDVFAAEYDFRKLTVRGLTVHCVVETPETTNLQRIWARRRIAPGPSDFVRFRDARVVDGSYLVDDSVTDPKRPTLLHLLNVEMVARDLQVDGEPRTRDVGDVRLDGLVAQQGAPARVSLVAWAPPWTPKPTFTLHGAITGLDVSQLPQYVDDSSRWWLGGDLLHLVGTMRAKDGVVEEGAIVGEVAATGSLLPMRFTGPYDDPVFDERSKLADLFHFGFARLGRVAVIGDVGSTFYDVGESVAGGAQDTVEALSRVDPLGALRAAGGGVVGSASSIGKRLVGGVKRLLGVGGDAPADEAERQDAAFSVLHAQRRRAMLEAAEASSAGGGPERRRRLHAELGEPDDPGFRIIVPR
jgi:hypothetical protein